MRDAVDHEHVLPLTARFELQAKLFLDGRDEGRPAVGNRWSIAAAPRGRVGRPRQVNVVRAAEARAVDDRATLREREYRRSGGDRHADHIELAGTARPYAATHRRRSIVGGRRAGTSTAGGPAVDRRRLERGS